MLLVLSISGLNAQRHVCGMSISDQETMTQMFDLAGSHHNLMTLRGDKIYIPVKFHMVADDNGKGRVSFNTILNQLNVLNTDYAAYNFVFYLKDNYNFSSFNSTLAYDNPRDNENILKVKKDAGALNVFVVNNIGGSGVGAGIVLGYYSPSNDFIVMMASEAVKSSNTLSHEVGHFFNLRHTFYGWEASPYEENEHGNPCVYSLVPNTNIQVEKVDKSNCSVAADQLCDTPPDFNFGLTAGGCFFEERILDKNLDTIRPMKENQMSYFSDCGDYKFTPNQETRMRANYDNFLRNYIRSSYVPVTDTLPGFSVPITPKSNAKEDVYTSVHFEWEDQHATYYLLEIKNSSEYYHYFLPGSITSKDVTNLLPNKIYVWAVRAFHDGFTGTTSPQINFRTGTLQTDVKDLTTVTQFIVKPNPAYSGMRTMLSLTTEKGGNHQFRVFNYTGQTVQEWQSDLKEGQNDLNVSTNSLSKGMYYISVSNETGTKTTKLIIQ